MGCAIPFMALFYGFAELAFEGAFVPVLQNSIVLLFLAALIQQFIGFVMLAAGVSVLAVIYRQFSENVPIPEAPNIF